MCPGEKNLAMNLAANSSQVCIEDSANVPTNLKLYSIERREKALASKHPRKY